MSSFKGNDNMKLFLRKANPATSVSLLLLKKLPFHNIIYLDN